jgi:hypothetical protein
VPTGLNLVTTNGSDSIHFQPGHSYRMAFIGRGATFEGRLYELPDTTTPVLVVQTVPDATYPSGQNGLVIYDNSGGQGMTDVTFDNYYATDIEPPRLRFATPFPGLLVVSYPAEASSYVLQCSEALPGTATDWKDITDVVLVEDEYVFGAETDPAAGGSPQKFFRLIRR